LHEELPVVSEHGGTVVVVVLVIVVVSSINTVVVRRNEVVVLACVVVSLGADVVVVGLLVGPNVVVTLCNGCSVVVVLVLLDNPSAVVLLALLPSCAYVDVINSKINISFIVLLNASFIHSHMLSGVGPFFYYPNDITWTIPWVTLILPPVTYSMPF
tara:strand:- start:203 stop:673 length:471 start_codon:yes stop_codon:yes gene_type:complete